MLSRRLMVLSGFAALGSGALVFFKDRDDFIWVFGVGVGVFMLSYVFQHQIDNLSIRGVAQRIDKSMQELLSLTAPHYSRMPVNVQLMIQDRMARWMMRKEFINQNEHELPNDIKYLLAYYACLLTMHQQDYQYDIFDRIVFYEHPFLTPSISDDVHIVEVESTDGTMIYSIPHLLKGHMEKGYYNIAVHATAEAYRHQYMKEPVIWGEDIWERLETISGISKETLDNYIGIPVEDPWPVAVHHQVTYAGTHIPEVEQIFPQLSGAGITVTG